MAADDFTWKPDSGAQVAQEPRVLSAKMGDGYEQRRLNGINAAPQTWSLSFSGRSDAEAAGITQFLQTQYGVTSFLWTPPGGTQSRFVCRKWQRSFPAYGANSITAEFNEVYE